MESIKQPARGLACLSSRLLSLAYSSVGAISRVFLFVTPVQWKFVFPVPDGAPANVLSSPLPDS